MIVPTDARRELYGLQTICAGTGLSYADLIWSKRYPAAAPKSAGAWPFRRADDQPHTNVTQIKRAGRK